MKSQKAAKLVTVNGKHPYKIYAKYLNPQTNEIQVLKSKNVWVDQNIHLTEKKLTRIEVWVDPQNYKNYLINTNLLV